MLKPELINAINEKLPGLQLKEVELVVDCMLGQIIEALYQGERVEVRGFGCFDWRTRQPRIGRNPKTGEAVHLPATTAVYFKPGKEMRDRVNAMRERCDISD